MSGPVVRVTSVCLVAFCVCDRCNLLSSQLLDPTVDLRSLLITLTTKVDGGEQGWDEARETDKGAASLISYVCAFDCQGQSSAGLSVFHMQHIKLSSSEHISQYEMAHYTCFCNLTSSYTYTSTV